MLLVGGVVAWCSWLTIRIFGAEKDIAVNTSNDKKVGDQITELKADFNSRVDKLEKHMGEQFDKVFEKIDLIRK